MDEPGEESSGSAAQIARYGGYGLTLGVAIALFAWLGALLDERLGTKPLFILLGSVLGFVGGFYRLYHDLTRPDESDGPDAAAGGYDDASRDDGED